jgi:peptidoglycan/xylan/chitin deacetylase (PgdA/CDA1 family)
MNPGGLPILTYHAIDTTGGVTATDPSWFAETLDALREAGFRAVDLGDWIARGRPDVERGYALTFDDGLRSILNVAHVVTRHRIPATVFLVADRMGTDNDWPGQPSGVIREPLLSWSDAEALQKAGFRFAAHGLTHTRLDRCNEVELHEELRGARDAIDQRLGGMCRLFAYPYGVETARVRQAAAQYFDAAFGTRLDVASASEDPYRLSRIDAYYLRSRNSVDRLCSGRWRSWLTMRRTLREARQMATDPLAWISSWKALEFIGEDARHPIMTVEWPGSDGRCESVRRGRRTFIRHRASSIPRPYCES